MTPKEPEALTQEQVQKLQDCIDWYTMRIKKAGVRQGSVWVIEERDGGYVVVRKPDHQNRLRVTMSPSAWIEFCYLKYLKMMCIVPS